MNIWNAKIKGACHDKFKLGWIKKTLRLLKRAISAQLTQTFLSSPNYNLDPLLLPISNDEPARKLSWGKELFLPLINIRLKLWNEDLSFQISNGKVSQIFIFWIKLLSKELSVLVIWLSRRYQNVLRNYFQKLEQ